MSLSVIYRKSQERTCTTKDRTSHVGIENNKRVDEAANIASNLPQNNVPLAFETAKTVIKRRFRDKWKSIVNNIDETYRKVVDGSMWKPKKNGLTR